MSIYDEDKPLTAFGRRWHAASLCTPLLAWLWVALAGAGLDAVNLSPLESGTSLGTLAAFVASAAASTTIAAGGGHIISENGTKAVRRFLTAAGGLVGLTITGLIGVRLVGQAAVTFALCCVVVTLLAAVIGFVLGRVPAEHHDVRVAYYTGLTGLGMGLYLAYSATVGVWNWPAGISWGLALLCGMGFWKPVRLIQIKFEAELREARRSPQQPVKELARAKTEAEKMQDVFTAAGVKGVRVLGNPRNPKILTRSGWGLHIAFPDDDMNVHYDSLTGARKQLERAFGRIVDGGLRTGAIRFAKPRNKAGQEVVGGALVYIDVVDILAEVLIAPEPTGKPRSVYDLVHVGTFIDGTPIELPIMWLHVLIGGQTRKGKSSFYDLILEYLGTCPDAVVWFGDGKGGSTLAPHMEPFAYGEVDPVTGDLVESCIDWPAVHRVEVERQLRAFIKAAKSRPGIRRRPEYAAANAGDKWRASPEFPAIFLIIDEGYVFFGQTTGPEYSSAVEGAASGEMSALLTEAMVLGAGECCYLWIAVQRGTVTMIGNGDAKSQQSGRICLPVQSRSEASEFFESDIDASQLAAELTHPGSCVITGFGLETPMQGKFMTIGVEPTARMARVRRTAILRGRLAGILDEPTAAAIAEFGYEDRLDDDHLYFVHGTPRPASLHRWEPARAAQSAVDSDLDSGSAKVIPMAGRTSARDRLGLADVKPFGGDETTAAPPDVQLDDEEAAQFEEIAALAAGLPAGADRPKIVDITDTHVIMLVDGRRVAVVRDDVAAAEDTPDAYQRFLDLVDRAGGKGITGAEALRQLGPLAPAARQTIYTWRDRGVRDGRILVPHSGHSAPFYSPAGWAAAQGQREEAA